MFFKSHEYGNRFDLNELNGFKGHLSLNMGGEEKKPNYLIIPSSVFDLILVTFTPLFSWKSWVGGGEGVEEI